MIPNPTQLVVQSFQLRSFTIMITVESPSLVGVPVTTRTSSAKKAMPRATCLSDVGRVRQHNEDSCGADAECGLWVVADGMGGHTGGAVASGLAVTHILRLVADGLPLVDAVWKAHQHICNAPLQGIGAFGMGTTVVAVQLTGWSYRICWAGDSRAYVFGAAGLTQITVDNSYVQELMDAGKISAQEARLHPRRNIVTQCLGADGQALDKVGEVCGELCAGEMLLLCTDGLTNELSDNEIAVLLAKEIPIHEKAQRLVDQANSNGGSDNITVALIAMSEENPGQDEFGALASTN